MTASTFLIEGSAQSVADLAGDAAALVARGCQPQLRPYNDARYAELLDRYRSDAAFRDITDAVAEGFGLVIVAAHESEGLMPVPTADSIFSLRLSDLRLPVNERMLRGLIHVAIAARVYPTPADLDSEDVRRSSVDDVDQFIRQVCKSLRKQGTDTAGLDLGQDLDAVWRSYLAMRPVKYSDSKGRKPHLLSTCSQFWVKSVFDWLVAQGYATPAPELGDGAYRLRHRFRLQVAEAAGTDVLEALAALARRFDSEQSPLLPAEDDPAAADSTHSTSGSPSPTGPSPSDDSPEA